MCSGPPLVHPARATHAACSQCCAYMMAKWPSIPKEATHSHSSHGLTCDLWVCGPGEGLNGLRDASQELVCLQPVSFLPRQMLLKVGTIFLDMGLSHSTGSRRPFLIATACDTPSWPKCAWSQWQPQGRMPTRPLSGTGAEGVGPAKPLQKGAIWRREWHCGQAASFG